MDCNCNQNGRGYRSGMERRNMPGNNRNMYYTRGQSNGRRGTCNPASAPGDQMTIGMGYVPWQKWQNIYDLDEALKRGTIFEELDKPYLGRPVKA